MELFELAKEIAIENNWIEDAAICAYEITFAANDAYMNTVKNNYLAKAMENSLYAMKNLTPDLYDDEIQMIKKFRDAKARQV